MNIELLAQETDGTCKFNGQPVVTIGFQETFGVRAQVLAIKTLAKILTTYKDADYLQVCKYDGVKYFVIDDGGVVTFLLPEEY